MSCARALLVVMLVAMTACSGDPPDKEMQQAQGAIDAARAAGADVYAAEELSAAQSALEGAKDAVAARDYRLALNHALDSRQRAQNAARQAADGKAVARVEADHAVTEATALVAKLQARFKAPNVVRLPARVLAAPRTALANGERLVQEARSALSRGDFAGARNAAASATTALSAAARDLDAATAPPPPRRR